MVSSMKTHNNNRIAALLLGHGSRVREANDNMLKVVKLIKEKNVFLTVEASFLELCPPSIPQGIKACAEKGAEKIIIAPYFLHTGMHVKRDLPDIIKKEAEKYPHTKIVFANNIGFHPVLSDIMMDRLLEASDSEDIRDKKIPSEEELIENKTNDDPIKIKTCGKKASHKTPLKPGEIAPESFRIILEEMGENHFNPYELSIVQRVIHSSGDFEFGKKIHFHPRFFEAVKETLSASKAILADVSMVLAGANQKLLKKFGMDIHCFISDEEIMEKSRQNGQTRASLGIQKGTSIPNLGGIIVGNAPTALREVIRLHTEGIFKSGFVVAVPVGFVDAEESKDAFIRHDIPGVTIRGRKGGSPTAAAILNAVLMLYDKFGDRIVDGDDKNARLFLTRP